MKHEDYFRDRSLNDLLAEAREKEALALKEKSSTELIVRENQEVALSKTEGVVEDMKDNYEVAKVVGSDIGRFLKGGAKFAWNTTKFLYMVPSFWRGYQEKGRKLSFSNDEVRILLGSFQIALIVPELVIPLTRNVDNTSEFSFNYLIPTAIRLGTNTLSGTYEYLRHKKKGVIESKKYKSLEGKV